MEKRIFGATDGIRAKVGEWPLRPNALRMLGRAVAKHFGRGSKILIGRDTRASGVWMAEEFRKGAEAEGMELIDYGVLPTPALQVLVKGNIEASGGVMMTASHNPASDNGLKVFRVNGDKLTDEEELEVEKLYFEVKLAEDDEARWVEDLDLVPKRVALRNYVTEVQKVLGELKLDSKILYDGASGAGYYFDKAVMESFGIQVEMLCPEPDGRNINAGYGALYPEKLAEKCKAMKIPGVAMDGDADRVILVDEEGRIWDGDREVCALARYLQEQNKLMHNAVVLTEYSNLGAIHYLNDLGVRVEKVVNGDRFVAQKCNENGYVLGSEFSGHIMYLPWLNSSDGVFVTLMIQNIMHEKACRLADLWPEYEMMPSRQWGLAVREKPELTIIAGWNEALAHADQLMAGKGRIFCRYSGTENKLRILVEGEDAELVKQSGELLAEVIKKEIGV